MRTAGLALAGVLVTGVVACEAAPPADGWDPTQSKSTRVAQIELPQGQTFEIYDTPTGEFAYSQAGKYGIAPQPIPEAVWKEADPVKIFQAMAPGRAVPAQLVTARDRALERLQQAALASAERPAGTVDSDGAQAVPVRRDGVEQRQFALGPNDVTKNAPTGQAGCPFSQFQTWWTDGRPMCPASTGRSGCWANMAWAFQSSWDAWESYGDVCQDQGAGVFRVSNGDPNNPTDTYTVNAGTWRYVRYAGTLYCIKGSCQHVRNFKKFDLSNFGFGVNSAHFGWNFGF